MFPARAGTIGWRERVSLPRFCPTPITAKVDTGAKTSSLHAEGLTLVERGGETLARFELLPDAAPSGTLVTAPVIDVRTVRSSNGLAEDRPVIRTEVELGPQRFEIDLTLTDRAEMEHRMLLGRRALEDRFWVDVGRAFLLGGGPCTT